ncbi:MAG TPA: ABC transporter permease [Candidatus Choladousia intestinavium]|uniref:ABC transporter permease n=1 Tax=Candidatus Choladousia intestinavium TaxID=2840727 RepID=A0A9D1AA03_9FIRM|nr:ABC transporter permease [Candidatus Choladousia intestinavium]
MRVSELMRLVWLNINQNKFKSVMTSIGIIVGAATIVLVIGIGRGGQMDVAEEFAQLNAGAIDVSYSYEGEEESSSGFSFGSIGQFFGNMFGGGRGGQGNSGARGTGENGFPEAGNQGGGSQELPGGEMGNFDPGSGENQGGDMPDGIGEMPEEGSMPEGMGERSESQEASEGESQEASEGESEEAGEEETSMIDDRLNQEEILLSEEDVEEIQLFVSDITGATISYSTQAAIEGGNLTSQQTYTVAGVQESYYSVSKLSMDSGEFLTEDDNASKAKVCVLGSTAAQELFETTEEATGSVLYIDDRAYTVVGVLGQSSTVSGGISPDTSIFIPYQTGIKYITGESVNPTITVVAADVNSLDSVIEDVETLLEESYPNATFDFEDSGSRMEAAESSNEILTLLLSAMAAIVFVVGGIGIMNVLFVSVKERTNEIGILKALGTSRMNILLEFLAESAAISLIGGIIGVALSFAIAPVAEYYDVRTEINLTACLAALGFAVLTGTVFGFYPAWKASKLEPVEALNEE